MTQVATPDSVMGNFKDQAVTFNGRTYQMTEQGDLCWVEVPASIIQPDGQSVSPDKRTQLPIVMSTGSHHMQVYWFPMGKGRMLGQFPLVYLKEEDRWVPRKSCFLEPPTDQTDLEVGRWNNTCLQCHTTNPKQLLSRDFVFDTKVSEFGISCEACHGPGEEHIAFQRAKASETKANSENTAGRVDSTKGLSEQPQQLTRSSTPATWTTGSAHKCVATAMPCRRIWTRRRGTTGIHFDPAKSFPNRDTSTAAILIAKHF